MQSTTFSVELSGVRLLLTAQNGRFRLSGAPSYAGLHEHIKALHRHSEYELFFVPDASLTVHTVEREQHFSDALVILPPSLSHHVSYDGASSGYYLYFTAEATDAKKRALLDRLIARLSGEIVSLPLSEDERFYLKKLDCAWDAPCDFERLPHLLALLLGEILARLVPLEECAAPKVVKYGKYINTIDAFLSAYYTEQVQLSDLAQALYLCPKQTSRIVRRAYGCSFSELLRRQRLDVACMLLCHTRLEIGEIAAQVGYEYGNYFYTVFRKAYGMTPQQYRAQHQLPSSKRDGLWRGNGL